MARKRISMKKIRKVLKLKYDSNLSQREIGRVLNISKSVVGEYLSLFKTIDLTFNEAMKLSDDDIIEKLQNQREASEKYNNFIKEIPTILKKFQYKGMTKLLVWEDYIKKYPEGYQYSRFCHHFRELEKSKNISMKQHHIPGDKMFVDYTGSKLFYIDPLTKQEIYVEVYVAILGGSGLTYAEASLSQQQEDFVRSTERAFRFFGGSTKAIVPDNLKSAVTKADKYDPVINPLFDDFANYYRSIVIPARAYKPKDKSLAENAVRLTYQRVFAPLGGITFYSLDDLNSAILDKVEAHNNKKLQILDVSRRELFIEIEKEELKTLPPEPYPMKSFEERTVYPDYHILLSADKSYYSVPWQLKGLKVRVIFDERNVAIYHKGERLVQHVRTKKKGSYSTLESHMPKNHNFYASWSDEKFLIWSKNIGAEAERVISHLLNSKRHPQQAYRTCMGILSLSKTTTAIEFNTACRMAWNHGRMNSREMKEYIKEVQRQNLDIKNKEQISKFPEHGNLRGHTQYK